MNRFRILTILVFPWIMFSGCNTLHNFQTIDMEILVPATVVFPKKPDTIAVRYNNFNAPYNPEFAEYSENNKQLTDSTNTDSTAAEVYYNYFLQTLKSTSFFDSVAEIERNIYSNIVLSDSLLKIAFPGLHDSIITGNISKKYTPAANFWSLAGNFQPEKENSVVKYLDPVRGLYTKEELTQLADSTNAQLLLSLDYFTTIDRKLSVDEQNTTGIFDVFVVAYWNFYDLETTQLSWFYDRVDTITWDYVEGLTQLPQRTEGILEAAEITAGQFADFLIPHWIEVQRIYYRSGQIDLKQTNRLVAEGKWLESAEIWKQHVNNPNKKIAAKCKFNMALACEMLNQFDAAVDWAVQSFLVFGQKNPVHAQNCLDYINILNQRKLDIKRIEFQTNPEAVSL
jgi:hypothetical protein